MILISNPIIYGTLLVIFEYLVTSFVFNFFNINGFWPEIATIPIFFMFAAILAAYLLKYETNNLYNLRLTMTYFVVSIVLAFSNTYEAIYTGAILVGLFSILFIVAVVSYVLFGWAQKYTHKLLNKKQRQL